MSSNQQDNNKLETNEVETIEHYIIGISKLGKTIGEGTFGKVKLGKHILTGQNVAIKILEKERITDKKDIERVSREIRILKQIRHINVIQLYEVIITKIIETPKELYLITEYAEGGELFDYIVNNIRIKEPEACTFFHQIVSGACYLHKHHIVHRYISNRDLKPENLLLDYKKQIKIVDFGLSNIYKENETLTTACGSPCYAAPEMIEGKQYIGSQVDAWSCGIILFALLCGYLPFEDPVTSVLYKKIVNGSFTIPHFVSPEATDLIRHILNTDPKSRYTFDDIKKHRWFRQIQVSPEKLLDQNIDTEILDLLSSYGFDSDKAISQINNNKHNNITTTYYLLTKKRSLKSYKGEKMSSKNEMEKQTEIEIPKSQISKKRLSSVNGIAKEKEQNDILEPKNLQDLKINNLSKDSKQKKDKNDQINFKVNNNQQKMDSIIKDINKPSLIKDYQNNSKNFEGKMEFYSPNKTTLKPIQLIRNPNKKKKSEESFSFDKSAFLSGKLFALQAAKKNECKEIKKGKSKEKSLQLNYRGQLQAKAISNSNNEEQTNELKDQEKCNIRPKNDKKNTTNIRNLSSKNDKIEPKIYNKTFVETITNNISSQISTKTPELVESEYNIDVKGIPQPSPPEIYTQRHSIEKKCKKISNGCSINSTKIKFEKPINGISNFRFDFKENERT